MPVSGSVLQVGAGANRASAWPKGHDLGESDCLLQGFRLAVGSSLACREVVASAQSCHDESSEGFHPFRGACRGAVVLVERVPRPRSVTRTYVA